jgi:gas vesicle protein
MKKDPLDEAARTIKKAGADVKDAVREVAHRTNAEGERAKRKLLGDELTPTEKAGSALNEGKERVQAEIDRAKRRLRDDT